MAKAVLLTYSLAVSVLALEIVFGLFGLSREVTAGRTTALREDLNQLGTHMGLAVIIFIGLCFSSTFKHFATKFMMGAMALLPLLALAKTGSRGGLAAFIAGLVVFLAPHARVKWRLAPALMAIIIMASVAYMVASNPDFLERWYQSYYDKDFAQRETIFPAAVDMILEKPIFGWHRESWRLELQFGSSSDSDPHNLFLHLLLEVGIVGTIPFLVGLWLCGRCAWRARDGNLGLLPLSLFAVVLVASIGLTTAPWKPFWLVLALTVGSAEALTGWRKGSSTSKAPRPLRVSANAKQPSFSTAASGPSRWPQS